MGAGRRPPKRPPVTANQVSSTTSKQPFNRTRRNIGSAVGLVVVAVDALAPHTVLDLLAIVNAPDDLHKLWGIVTWSFTHFALWAPMVLGISIICWANWSALRAKLPQDGGLRLALILVLLAISYFVPTGAYTYGPSHTESASGPKGRSIFETSTGGEISARNAQLPANPPFAIGHAETGGKINLDGSKWIGFDSPSNPSSTGQTGGITGNQTAQNITNYNAPVTQREPAPINPLEEAMSAALADPTYSPETKLVIEHQRDLLPLKQEYRRLQAPRPVSNDEIKSPKAIEYFNGRLRALGKNWKITPENMDSSFGNVMLDSSMNSSGTGVKISGGGGNTFDKNNISGGRAGVDLENTKNNNFKNNNISSPTIQLK
jgi:parallel beta-helix repeat protein